ncbi:MAG: hypothetical protein Q9218_003903 [Villophora microphyllina]
MQLSTVLTPTFQSTKALLVNILLMHFTTLIAFAAGALSAPVSDPTADGFPNPGPAQLLAIQKKAGGYLPNGPLPTTLSDSAITSLQLIATNELFEVAFFSDLLSNITTNTPGYQLEDIAPLNRTYVIMSLNAIVNQEKLHALGANAILANANQSPIAPCQYTFPVQDFVDAIVLAQTFTDIVLGALPDVQFQFAVDGGDEPPGVRLLGSIIAQEGQQDGFFRYAEGKDKTPSAAPFLTGGLSGYAFTALQSFIVPESCPKPLNTINLPTFKPLTLQTQVEARNMTLTFGVEDAIGREDEEFSVVYLSGQNLPLVVPISNVRSVQGPNIESLFDAEFPFEAGFANGVTIAAVVKGKGPFASAAAVVSQTVYGPALIEAN